MSSKQIVVYIEQTGCLVSLAPFSRLRGPSLVPFDTVNSYLYVNPLPQCSCRVWLLERVEGSGEGTVRQTTAIVFS